MVGGTLDFQANDREETVRQQTLALRQNVEKSDATVPYLDRSNIKDKSKKENKVLSPTDFDVSLPAYRGIQDMQSPDMSYKNAFGLEGDDSVELQTLFKNMTQANMQSSAQQNYVEEIKREL